MSDKHPVEPGGLLLPACDWPADRAAPQPLELIRRFCNTANIESGADSLSTPAGLDVWLADQGQPAIRATASELGRVVGLREIFRRHAAGHRASAAATEFGEPDAPATATFADLAAAVGHIPMRLAARPDRLAVEPAADSSAADRLLAHLALIAVESDLLGTWRRLKACRNCSWVFYDHSKNRSGQWCSMQVCGARAKARRYRRRTRSVAPA